ncbi:hypothetical protein [Actinopolymorpha alba]|uniref:hypothetical protein n=1 Tax=Actinopolymorpha alba TaxID=533267 RepID=UPI00036BA053|nr:hypothetical protein [Actinopolymorpha alba]
MTTTDPSHAESPTAGARTSLDAVLSAASELVLGGRWDAAALLLDSTVVDDPLDRVRLALTVAAVETDRDFWLRTSGAEEALKRAASALETAPDRAFAWELDLLRLRRDYAEALFASGDAPTDEGPTDPTGPAASVIADLTNRATELHEAAPAPARAGWTAFYHGLIVDVLAGDHASAPAHYEEALALAERWGDDVLASYALRHLGGHTQDAGDLERTKDLWERSTVLRQSTGFVPGALAQQILLAVLARETGDTAAASALATEIGRWARALGIEYVAAQADGLAQS